MIAAGFGIWFIFTSPESSNHPNFLALWSLLAAALVLSLASIFFYAWYIKVYIKNYFYAGEEHFITIKKGVFAPTEIHVQWQKIQDVYVDQDILDRIMGLYDVHIASATAASGIEAHIDGVDSAAAEGLKNFLLGKISGTGTSLNTAASAQTPPPTTAKTNEQRNAPVTLSTTVSSEKFPLTSKWLILRTVTTTITSVIYSLIAVGYFYLKSDNNVQGPFGNYILGFLILTVVIVVFRQVSLYLWKKNYAFSFNEHTIYFRTGVLSISEKNMPYSSIQDVTVQQGFIERMLGLANVMIENAAQMTVQGKNGINVPVFSGLLIQGISHEDAQTITSTLKEATLNKQTSRNGL